MPTTGIYVNEASRMQAPIHTSLMDLSTVPCIEYMMTGHSPMHSNPTDSIGLTKNAITCKLNQNYIRSKETKLIKILFI